MKSTETQKQAMRKYQRKYYQSHPKVPRDKRMRGIDAKIDKMLPEAFLSIKEEISNLLRDLPCHFLSGWATKNYLTGTIMYVCHRDGLDVPGHNTLRRVFGYKNKKFQGNKFYKKLKNYYEKDGGNSKCQKT